MPEKIRTPGPLKAFYPMMIVPGIVLLLAPSTVESIMKYYGFRESMGGLLQVAYFAGGVFGILSITFLIQRYSVRQIALSQVLLLSGSLLAASFAPWYPMLLGFLVVAGFANGILIAFPGVYVTRTCGETSHREQNRLYTFFALGVLAGPLLTSLIVGNHHALWRWAFRVPAIMILPLSIPLLFAAFEPLEGVERLSRKTMDTVLQFNRRLFYGLFLALLLYIAAEAAVSMWLITFLKVQEGMQLRAAELVLTGLWAGLTFGRWICGWLTQRIDPFRILTFLTIASGIALLAAPLAGSRTAAIIIYPLVGLFYSGIYPLLIGYIAIFPTSVSSAVFTIFVAAGAAGGAVLPYFVGLVNQFAGRVAGMCSIAIPIFGVLVCLYKLKPDISVASRPSGARLVEADTSRLLDEE
ncbi:MAG TPA: MFS transporter [Candidatus Anoxymicrobiaceae bacterium]